MQRISTLAVQIAAGSDCGWSYYLFGGFRHEIESLASCGMGTAGALRAGTLDSAAAMGWATRSAAWRLASSPTC